VIELEIKMNYFNARSSGRVFVLRLDPGDLLLESIKTMIQKEAIRDAYVASAIGTLDYCVMHMVMTTGYPPVEYFARWADKPLELSSIDGLIANGVPHFHMVVSDHEKAYSGHLEEGCRVLYLAEIVIVELDGANLTRVRNEQGIQQLIRQDV
jgi:predicted DNA-binding protein with PD1-like motif